MRKVYSFLALALISLVGALNASAQYYDAVGFDDLAYLEDITPGQHVVLQTASSGARDFFALNKKASIITEDCIYTFVEGTEQNGFKTYYLQQVSTGLYVATDQTLVKSRALAFNFFAKHPTDFYLRNEDTVPLDCDPTVIATYDNDHFGGVEPGPQSFVFTDVKHATSEGWSPTEATQKGGREDGAPWLYLASNWAGSAPFFGPWSDTNTWYLFEVAEKTGYALLEAAVEDLIKGDYETMFKAGTTVGQVPSEYVEAWIRAAKTATDLLNEGNEETNVCQQAAEELIAAYKACQENIIQMQGGGWFRMRIHQVEGNANYGEAAYAFGADGKGQWVNGTYEVPESDASEFTLEDAQFIWHLEADPEVEDGYKVRNYAENQYLGYVSGRSKVVPLADKGDQTYIIKPHTLVDGAFTLVPTQTPTNALHGQVNGHTLVYWTTDAGASAWVFEGVEQSVIDELLPICEDHWEEVAKRAKIAKLQALVDQSELAYNRGFAYKPECSVDGVYPDEVDGLVTDVEQLWTNAQETSEGPIENAIDQNFTTFWHTTWSSAWDMSTQGFHNLCADLGEAVNGVAVKLTQRWSGQNNAPKQVRAFAANEYEEVVDEETQEKVRNYKWEEQGVFQFEYLYDTEYDGTTKTKWTGVNSIPFKGNYRYLRLDFEKAINDANSSYNLSEIRFYKTVLDEELSRIKGVPTEIVDELKKQIGVAKNEIADGEPTDATLEALEAAYDNFIANYPDPANVQELLDEAKALHDAAQEDEDLGYYQQGAKEAFYDVIQMVEGQYMSIPVMSNNDIKTAEKLLNDAIEAFDSKLNKPVDGVYYRIRNAATTETKAQGAYLLAGGNGNSRIVWGNNDPNLALKLGYIWKCVKNNDGTYAFTNALTGNYMGTREVLDADLIYMSDTATVVRIETAKVPGKFVLRQGDTDAYLNTSPQGYCVTYYGDDENSFFTFVPESNEPWQGEQYVSVNDDFVHGLTLPFEVVSASEPLYKVLGVKDNLTLELVEASSAEAGEPFFLRRGDEGAVSIYPLAEKLEDLAYTFEPKTVNGLFGTLAPVEVEEGSLYSRVYENLVVLIYDTYTVGSNDAYLDMAVVPVTEQSGDVSLPLDDGVINGLVGINDVVNNNKTQNNIYDLSGRRVLVAKKGLYIINGKKVLVK